MTGRPIVELTAFVAEQKRETGLFPEFIILLPDLSIRMATWGHGTILLGPYGIPLQAENWPTHWLPLPDLSEFLNDQR